MNLASNPEDIFIITLAISLILFTFVHHNHYASKEKTPTWIDSSKKPLREEGDFAPVSEEYE